ncbi:hypothetical protein V6R21_21580 [Limibacter armeniacum]|uniref:hypothetical protein n=1 Tax=Limibacter armeniacum TaxID=466084 RepID=UPI002FE52969
MVQEELKETLKGMSVEQLEEHKDALSKAMALMSNDEKSAMKTKIKAINDMIASKWIFAVDYSVVDKNWVDTQCEKNSLDPVKDIAKILSMNTTQWKKMYEDVDKGISTPRQQTLYFMFKLLES